MSICLKSRFVRWVILSTFFFLVCLLPSTTTTTLAHNQAFHLLLDYQTNVSLKIAILYQLSQRFEQRVKIHPDSLLCKFGLTSHTIQIELVHLLHKLAECFSEDSLLVTRLNSLIQHFVHLLHVWGHLKDVLVGMHGSSFFKWLV